MYMCRRQTSAVAVWPNRKPVSFNRWRENADTLSREKAVCFTNRNQQCNYNDTH